MIISSRAKIVAIPDISFAINNDCIKRTAVSIVVSEELFPFYQQTFVKIKNVFFSENKTHVE
jgi:hypothetical protein